MVVVVPCLKTSVKYLGVFDYKDFYRAIIDILRDKGYLNQTTFKFFEKLYQEKHTQNPKEGNSGWIWWRTYKMQQGTQYVMQCIDVDLHTRFMRRIEMMEAGRKIRPWKGEVEINFNAYLRLDPFNTWKNHSILKHVHDLYINRIFGKRKDIWKISTRNDCYWIVRFLKEFFELRQFAPAPELFYRPQGWRLTGYQHALPGEK
jgi:hypothetical protein